MFAFALWDERRQTLMLARDRVGKKPLYYAVHRDQLFFASELHALLGVPYLSHEIDELSLDVYLTLGYIPAPRTIFAEIKKLEAGHHLLMEAGALRHSQYWSVRDQVNHGLEWSDALQETISRLRRATALRMVSDVPLGCFLSGGVDSSAVLSFMAEQSPQPVKTFSIGFPEQDYSELAYARVVAKHFGTDHHEFVLQPDAVGILDKLVTHFGEPFADSSALPMWYLSELTRQTVTVALTGDGGDELFGGYRWYQSSRILDILSRLPRRSAQVISSLIKQSRLRLLKPVGNGIALAALSPADQFSAQRQIFTRPLKDILYTQEFQTRTGDLALEWLADQYILRKNEDQLTQAMLTDLVTYMAEDLLVKVDRTSMAHSLECRSPLLDTDLVEWVMTVPSSYKVQTNRLGWPAPNGGKWLLREAIRHRLPPGFLDRPKQGFSVPLEYWFRGRLRDIVTDQVLDGPLDRLKIFNKKGIRQLVDDHFTGRGNHPSAIWALLVLATWVNLHEDIR